MTGPDVLLQIRQLVPDAMPVGRDTIGTTAGLRGAYILVLNLPSPVRFSRAGIRETLLSGWQIYVGSARGSGGIRARLNRHFRSDKAVHWHVDELTIAAAGITALAVSGGSECAIVERLTGSGLFEPSLCGFGSSDCANCEAHLLRPVQISVP